MLRLALLFVVIAVLAAIFGFFEIVPDLMWAARVCFIVFIVFALLSFLGGMFSRPVP